MLCNLLNPKIALVFLTLLRGLGLRLGLEHP
jgi:threonine/homoserine/homoserine lactone efflux protein